MAVKTEYCRSKEFDEFGFRIDEHGTPLIEEINKPNIKKKVVTPVDVDKSVHKEVLTAIFKIEPEIKYRILQNQVKDYFMRYGIKFGDNKAVEFITFYINEEMIEKFKPEKGHELYRQKCL